MMMLAQHSGSTDHNSMGMGMDVRAVFLQIFFLTLHLRLQVVSGAPAELGQNSAQNGTLSFECPEDQLYHNETESCVLIDSQGPCGLMMKFVQDEEDDRFGKCECDEETDSNSNCTYRPKFYWPAGKRCHKAFDQGPCCSNQWFIWKNDGATCAPNPCPKVVSDDAEEHQFWFPFGGMCYMTGTQGFCRESKYSVYIARNSISPVCLLNDACPQPAPEKEADLEERCRQRRYVGRCRKKMTFSFPTNIP